MELYLKQIPIPKPEQRIILAGDHTPWPRTEAPTLKDRTYEHGAKVIWFFVTWYGSIGGHKSTKSLSGKQQFSF